LCINGSPGVLGIMDPTKIQASPQSKTGYWILLCSSKLGLFIIFWCRVIFFAFWPHGATLEKQQARRQRRRHVDFSPGTKRQQRQQRRRRRLFFCICCTTANKEPTCCSYKANKEPTPSCCSYKQEKRWSFGGNSSHPHKRVAQSPRPPKQLTAQDHNTSEQTWAYQQYLCSTDIAVGLPLER
jgi:hypothetical protein